MGRGDHALDVTGLLGNLEVGAVQGRDGFVGALLHPCPEGLDAGDLVSRIGVEDRHGLLDAGSWTDAFGGLALQLLDAGEFLLAPLVGLGEVDSGADELTRSETVTVDADGVGLGGERSDLGGEGLCGATEVGLGGVDALSKFRLHGVGQVVGGGPLEVVVKESTVAGPGGDLLDEKVHLTDGGRDTGIDRGALGLQPAVESRAGGLQTTCDRRHLIGGLGGHLVDARGNAVEGEEVVSLVVALGLQTQAGAHGGDGDPVGVVGRHGLVETVQGVHDELVPGLHSGGGQVVVLILVEVQAEGGGQDGARRHEGVPVVVGNLVDL